MRLRPSGAAGPVAVSKTAFSEYYRREAETWEFMALTRARVVWASDEAFGAEVGARIEAALRQARDPIATRADAAEMRGLMAREHPSSGIWDLKRAPGGLTDIEFAAQYLQIIHASSRGPLRAHTGEALEALAAAGRLEPAAFTALSQAWTLQQSLSQLLRVALDEAAGPDSEPKAFRRRLAQAGGARDLPGLKARLAKRRIAARKAYEAILGVG
jgi:glutamate-ammonia-ligase adenylyltransferase